MKNIIKLKKTWLILIIAIVVTAFAFHFMNKSEVKLANKLAISSILLSKNDVFRVNAGSVASVMSFTGDLSPLNKAVISSEVNAVVSKVMVDAGQFVKKDQILAVLDDTELKEAVAQQEAQLASAKSSFELDKTKLNRERELYDEGFISKFAYAELETNYQNSLQKINEQQAMLKQSRKKLSNAIIRAPFSGYIYERNTDNGQLASQNSKLFSLASLELMQITASVPSEQVNKVKIGQMVNFQIEGDNQIYSGKISRVNPVAEQGTRSYLIYINFDNRLYTLKAGQFVKGTVILEQKDNINYLPTQGVRFFNGTSYALVLVNNKIIEKAIVIVIENKVNGVSGVTGLNKGDIVISNNVNTVKVGDKANILD